MTGRIAHRTVPVVAAPPATTGMSGSRRAGRRMGERRRRRRTVAAEELPDPLRDRDEGTPMRSAARTLATPASSRARPWSRARGRLARLLTLATALGLTLGLVGLLPASASAAYPAPGVVTGDVVVHDPSMVRTPEGEYLLYSTHGGLEARASDDRTAFERVGSAFPSPPAWWSEYSPEQDPWAPDISYHNGTYWMYYAVSSFGSNHSAIGLATSGTGQPGSWTDQGVVYATDTDDDHNAIDPNLLVDGDDWYLSFGSFWTGIKMIRVDPATGKRLGDEFHHLASRESTAVEAPQIVKQGDYYYLFVSFDTCCSGTDSTYNVRVGRSTSPTGPYVDADGVPMTEGGGTAVLETHDRVIGPGGQSVLRDEDGDLLVYHYYDGDDNGTPKLGLNLIDWSSGWPVLY